jgi:hypothetical protein
MVPVYQQERLLPAARKLPEALQQQVVMERVLPADLDMVAARQTVV